VRRIAIINQKGGVGKTTTAANLGAALARKGHATLLLDLDPQANLTVHLDLRPDQLPAGMFDVLVRHRPLRDTLQKTRTELLTIVPAGLDLAGAEQALSQRIGRETILLEALEAAAVASPAAPAEMALVAGDSAPAPAPAPQPAAIPSWEFVLMDCPPSLGVLSLNALAAATEVLIPLQTEFFALQGLTNLMDIIGLVRKRINPALRPVRILPCMVDARTNLSGEVIQEVAEHFATLLTRARIRKNVKLAEAPSFGRTVFEHAPDSPGAQDYDSLASEVLAS
jgi:chromosome partitioning protein